MFSFLTPIPTRMFRHAIAEAPAPLHTSLMSLTLRPEWCSQFVMAAPTIMAVPCWSSWNTGMFMRSLRRCSISKHSGALMSSRLMPPKLGSRRAIVSINASGSFSSISISIESIFANFLNRTAFPSITGLDASAPISPRPRTAVPFEITATTLPRDV